MRLTASITFMFREWPLLERFAAARDAGFGGVEIQRLAEGDVSEMARAAREADIRVILINVSSRDYMSGGAGLSGVPGLENEFRIAFETTLEAARDLDAAHVHLAPSRVPPGSTRKECLRVYEKNIRIALAISRAAGRSLLIEPMNPVDAPDALIHNTADAVALIDRIDSPRLGLQLDLYHAAMAGEDPVIAYARGREHVRHIQFSDAPGRHEPGTGHLGIPDLLRQITIAGYDGWFGAEYVPLHDTASSLSWMTALRAETHT